MKNTINKNAYIFFMALLLALLSVPILKSPLLLLAALYAYTLYVLIVHKDEKIIIYFILCCTLQNIIGIIFSEYFSSFQTQILLAVKDVTVYIYVGCRYLKKFANKLRFNIIDLFFTAFCIQSALSFLLGDLSLGTQITGFRSVSIPVFCYYFGYQLQLTTDVYKKIVDFIIITAMVLTVIGIIIYVLPENFWNEIGYRQFIVNKNYDGNGNVYISYQNFYTHDLSRFFGRLKRLVSFTADPLATAHIIALGLILALYYRKRAYITYIVLTVGLILGLSKSVIVILVIALIINIYVRVSSSQIRRFIEVIAIIGAVAFLVYMNRYVDNLEYNTAVGNHYSSLLSGVKSMTLFGNGLGTAGYNASILGDSGTSGEFNESFFAVVAAQTGLVGIVILYGMMISAIYYMYKKYKKYKNKNLVVAITCVAVIMFESFVSASSVSMMGSGIYFILAGIIYKLKEQSDELKNSVNQC